MPRIVFSVLFILGICFSIQAQVVFVTKTSSKKIGKNDLLEVSYEVQEGSIDNFIDPVFAGWQVVGGPNVSSSTVITNGRRTSSMSYQYVLQPLQTGRIKVAGAIATIDGKQFTSNSVLVQVTTKASEGQTNNAGVTDPLQFLQPDIPVPQNVYEENDAFLLKPNENIEEKTKKNVFAIVDVSKRTCYPGEAIRAAYKLYSRANMEAHISKRPSFSGFSSIDLPVSSNSEYEYEKRNGKDYKVYPIRSVQLYPLLTGVQTLQPVQIDATIQYRKLPQNPYAYDPLEGLEAVNFPFEIKSEPVDITVMPFPEVNKPANFDGVTGSFTIDAAVDYNELAKSEAGTLTVTISGSGNWAMVQQPKINWPADTDVFEPVNNEKLDSQSVPLSGKRTYQFPFTRSIAGKLVIPAIELSYFDADKKNYNTVSSQTISVTIKNTSTPLHKTTVEYTTKKVVDGTEIFTGIVKVIFPVVAVLLLVWFVVAYRKKQHNNRQEMVIKKEQERKKKPAYQTKYADLLQVNEIERQQTAGLVLDAPKHKKEYGFSNESITSQNEVPNFTGSQKDYFTSLKNNIKSLLNTNLGINADSLYATQQALIQTSVEMKNIDKIVQLLSDCEQHIYSPFAQSFNEVEYNRLYSEVKEIIIAKNNL